MKKRIREIIKSVFEFGADAGKAGINKEEISGALIDTVCKLIQVEINFQGLYNQSLGASNLDSQKMYICISKYGKPLIKDRYVMKFETFNEAADHLNNNPDMPPHEIYPILS